MSEQPLWDDPRPEDKGKPSFGRCPGWRAKNWPWTLRVDRPTAKLLTAWEEVWIEVLPRGEPDA